MEHQTFREMLARRPELWPIEESELRAHLQDCPECRVLAEAYARQTFLLHSLPEAIPPPALRAGVLDAIRRQPAQPLPLWRRPLALVPLAAALLVAGIGLSTLHPLAGGQHSAAGAATPGRATPRVIFEGLPRKRGAHDTSKSPALRRIRRAGPRRVAHPTAIASGYLTGGTVAQNPPVPVVPPVAAPPVVPTPRPAAVHVAAGAPVRAKQTNSAAEVARKPTKALPRHGSPVGGGAPSVPAPPSRPAPPAPVNPPTRPAPTAAPVPSPIPFTTPPVASYAPIRGTATASPTATPPPTPAPFASPYPGPQATPTPTP